MDLAKIITAFEEAIIHLKEEEMIVESAIRVDGNHISIKIEADNVPKFFVQPRKEGVLELW